MNFNYLLIFSLTAASVECRLTYHELADRAFNYFSDPYRIKGLSERDVDTILHEIDAISKRDGLDKNLVLQQLNDQLQKQMNYHAKNMHTRWTHAALIPAVVGAVAGIGLLGLTYLIYKKWDAPLNAQFGSIVESLKQYGISIHESKHDTHPGPNHVVHNHVINYAYARKVTESENATILAGVEQLLELRKKQNTMTGYESIPFAGSLVSFVLSWKLGADVYKSNPPDHKVCYEKYKMIFNQMAQVKPVISGERLV